MKHAMSRTPRLLAFLLLGAACAFAVPDPVRSQVPSLDGTDRPIRLDAVELFRVGGMEAPSWAEFGAVGSLGFDGDGNLLVLDTQAASITRISPEGEFAGTIGGPGEGPGELVMPLAMLVAADRIAVLDLGRQGFALFGADGGWIRNVTFDLLRDGLPTEEMVALPSGDIVARMTMRIMLGESGSDAPPQGEPLQRYSLEPGRRAEPVYYTWEPPAPGGPDTRMSAMGISFSLPQLQAFRPEPRFTALPDGRLAVADSVDYRIRLIDPEDGGQVGELRRPIEPVAVDGRIRELERERQRELAMRASNRAIATTSRGPSSGVSLSSSGMNEQLVARVEEMTFYPEIPVIERIAADPLGRLWVARASGTPGEPGPIDLIGADGRYLGTLPADGVRIPDVFGPGGRMAFVDTDDLGLPTIRVLRATSDSVVG